MTEKRGGSPLQELKMEFDRTAVMEVYNEDTDCWYRTTERDFRSFNGKRRLTKANNFVKGQQSIPTTIEYNGPVYAYGTNNEVPFTNSGYIEGSKVWEEERSVAHIPSHSNRI